MSVPLSQARFRAVSMELIACSDESRSNLLVVADDGTAITIECDNDSISEIQRHMARRASASSEAETRLTARDRDLGLADDGGTVAARDVRERIKAQRENVESRRIFEDLLENSDAAIIDYDFSVLFRVVQDLKRDGVRDLRGYVGESDERMDKFVGVVRINYANAAALRMLRVSSLQELVRQSTNIIDIAEAIFQNDTRIRRSEYLVADGMPIPVVYSLRVPRTEEEARRVPIVIMDLSDVRLAEAARQAAIAKSQFFSSMSHEIRTPLNGVIGNLELLALTSLDNAQFELIDDADKAAKALLGLIGNILDFTKIEAGKLTIEMGDISPAALVDEAVDVVQSLGRQKNISVAATFGPDVPCLVRGDAMRVRQILLNLIGNSVKCTEQGGVQVNLTVVSWSQETCLLRFDVHDSGRGFNQTLAARLFEPFTQEQPDAEGGEGTGLGLSICKSLVEAFDGTIGCEGVPDEGATFWFTLPVDVVRRAQPVDHPDLSKVRAMVIGGDIEVGQSLEAYFKRCGATVISEVHRTFSALATELSRTESSLVDVAVYVPEGRDDDASDVAQWLEERHIVPLLFGSGQPLRARLRQGFAAVIESAAGANYFDHNNRLLVGHAQARDRLVAQQSAIVSAFGPGLTGMQVLVLEDRVVNQTVIQKQLKKLGIDCMLAINGIKGLEVLDHQDFDLILCDCFMPRMDGYEFTRVLRKREADQADGLHVPVIALTANAFREDADKCLEAGMDDFISKPVTMDRLIAMLVKWLPPAKPVSVASNQPRSDQADTIQMIDMEALAEILGTNEPDMLNQMLSEFLTVAGTSLAEVETAVLSGGADSIKSAAHGAKGEARYAAASGLAGLYAEVERQANDDSGSLRDLLARAAVEIHRIEEFVRGRLEASQP
ncbi:ATP-binding protein [Oleispirillum naphthae]|uniref:ATP-binding protein n=1 Tax=Oleispirillum naphthae TaxID=2838853 RepID=UPI00308264D4